MPNFVEISQTVDEMWYFIDLFSKWQLSAMFDLWGKNLDDTQRALQGAPIKNNPL